MAEVLQFAWVIRQVIQRHVGVGVEILDRLWIAVLLGAEPPNELVLSIYHGAIERPPAEVGSAVFFAGFREPRVAADGDRQLGRGFRRRFRE